jgi:hypothetical protein
VGPKLRRIVPRGWTELLVYSLWLLGVPGTEVDDTQEGSRSRCCEALALLGC